VEINKQGFTIVLVEKNAELALEFARHGYELETDTISLEGANYAHLSKLKNSNHIFSEVCYD